MKKIILILVSVFALGSVAAIAASPLSPKKIESMAKKQAKTLTKEGWKVAPGALPMEAQLVDMYTKQYDRDDVGRPKFLIGESQPIGEFYDAAALQAMTDAKVSIARQLGSDISAKMEAELANKQLSQKQAASVAQVTAKAMEVVSHKLGRVVPLLTCHRELPNGNIQMMMQVGYPSIEGLEEAKEAIRAKLEEEARGLSLEFDCLKANK